MNYDQSLQYLNGLLKFGIKFGLERITALCDEFGNPQKQLRAIHVGGTNGKGHKFSYKYQLAKNMQGALTFFTNEKNANTTEDNYKRLQVDLIFKF